MYIRKLVINNFKCYEGEFSIQFDKWLNVLVWDNEAGKSTILEAIHLALTWWISWRYLKSELEQSLFNNVTLTKYFNSLSTTSPLAPPSVTIELFIEEWENDSQKALFEGSLNSEKWKLSGILFEIKFSERFAEEYSELIKQGEVTSLPIEYYDFQWTSFSRDRQITPKTIPLKSAFIDSSWSRFQNGSDIYVSRIIQDYLNEKQKIWISQAHRKMKDFFGNDSNVKGVNEALVGSINVSDKKIELSVDVSTKTAWETSLLTYLDDVPFHNVGKGEQCLIKTKLAISNQESKKANVLLLEEPENHLSHSNLNRLISHIKWANWTKQVLISTHSSFVANKLGIWNLLLLNSDSVAKKRNVVTLSQLTTSTRDFFEKLSGYDTLRVLLCRKAVLVEGPSDELVFQRAYMEKSGGILPIEQWVDVISVGTAFLRFLEIAKALGKSTAVITDNDGDYNSKITKKYADYEKFEFIKIFADSNESLNTLEPQIVNANNSDLSLLRSVLWVSEKTYSDESKLSEYMQKNKTECALSVFSSEKAIVFPNYILEAVSWAYGE
jgi:putative ATP-dependent endonuclease of the OLD family